MYSTEWIFAKCDLCRETRGKDILTIDHPAAPEGRAFIRECAGCGLKRLWPRPGEEILHKYYASDYGAYTGRRRSPVKQALWDLLRDGASGAPGRGRTLWPLRPLFRFLAERVFDTNVSLHTDPLPRILDVGCGFGDLLLYWQSRGAEVLGVDFDQRAVDYAAGLGLRVLKGGLEEQNLPPASFDVIVFNHSLEHLPHPVAALKKAASLLRKDGEIHITVPNGDSAGLAVEKLGWGALCFPVHFWFFDVETLCQALKIAGFSQFQIRTSNIWRGRCSTLQFRSDWFGNIEKIIKINLSQNTKGDLLSLVAICR